MIEHLPLASSGLHIGDFTWTGDFTTIDLIAASTNALNGALLARRPDHYKNWTVVGIILMALLMGLGGGITRDVLVGQVPSALTNPAYITLALAFGIAGYLMAYKGGQLFREGLFQFMTSFSLPWYAIAGAQKGVDGGAPGPGHARPRGGRPDRRAVVRRRHLRRAAQAVRAGRVVRPHRGPDRRSSGWWSMSSAPRSPLSAGIAFVIGYTFRVLALYRAWEEPLAKEPTGVYKHDDGRPMLGRKLKDKSQRELDYLGLTVDKDKDVEVDPKLEQPAAGKA